jgi:hypothetical protein
MVDLTSVINIVSAFASIGSFTLAVVALLMKLMKTDTGTRQFTLGRASDPSSFATLQCQVLEREFLLLRTSN